MMNPRAQVTPAVRISAALAEASESAAAGDVPKTDSAIKSARESAGKAGISFSKEKEAEIAEIAKSARVNGVGAKLAEAAHSAEYGRVADMEASIKTAREYADQAGITLSAEQEEQVALLATTAKSPEASQRGRHADFMATQEDWDWGEPQPHQISDEERKRLKRLLEKDSGTG